MVFFSIFSNFLKTIMKNFLKMCRESRIKRGRVYPDFIKYSPLHIFGPYEWIYGTLGFSLHGPMISQPTYAYISNDILLVIFIIF